MISATFLSLLFVLPRASTTQDTQEPALAPLATAHRLNSEVLGEARSFAVHTPKGYEEGDTRYPVLYVTDGPGHLLHTAGTLDFLARNNRMPRMILVAIGNTDRTRDMTPTRASMLRPDGQLTPFPTSGGADAFLDFFEKELIPWVDSNYRTQPYRVFAGHSFGGLLAVHSFLERTSLFNAYLAVSPSLWWDKGLLPRRAEAFFAKRDGAELNCALYVTLGSEGGTMLVAFERFNEILEEQGDIPGFTWGAKHMLDEDHGSIVLRSHYHGLLHIFQSWRVPRDKEGAVLGGFEGVRRHYAKLSKQLGYSMPLPEELVNRLGYEAIGAKKLDEAIAIFKSNVEHFPNSPNVYDSLGDAYMEAEDFAQAFASYQRAVALAQKDGHQNLELYQANLEKALRKKKGEAL